MTNINEVYENVQSLAQKAKHGTIRVVDFNKYANLASMDLFNERIGSVRDYYKLGKALEKTSPGMTKDVDQSLRVFLVPDESTAVASGKATLPSNCEFVDSVTANGKSVKWVPKNKIASYVNSTIDVPTTDYPIYCDITTQLNILPVSITSVLISYYKTPQTVVWGYTLVSNRPVYSSGASTNFEWNPTEKLELISRILGYVGISIRDQELLAYGEQQENTVA